VRFRKWLLLGSCIAALEAYASDRELQAVVDRFIPHKLLVQEAGFAKPNIRSAFVTTNFSSGNDESGQKYVVAAYSNGTEGAVSVLQRHGQDWIVVSTTEIGENVTFPGVQLRDLDGDRRPEIISSFLISPGDRRGSWIFAWDDEANALVSMEADPESSTETEGGGIVERFVDLDGDDKLEIVRVGAIEYGYVEDADGDPGPLRPSGEVRYFTERLRGRVYEPWKDLAFYGSFAPIAKNRPDSVTFVAAQPGHDYLLRVASSGGCKSPHIRSAEVRLNGALIAGPTHFNAKTCVIQLPVLLLQENTLTVQILDSRKSGREEDEKETPALVVTIEGS